MRTNMTQEQIDLFREDCETILRESMENRCPADQVARYVEQVDYAYSLEPRRGWVARRLRALVARLARFARLETPAVRAQRARK